MMCRTELTIASLNFALVQNTSPVQGGNIDPVQKNNPASLACDPGHITAIAKDLQ